MDKRFVEVWAGIVLVILSVMMCVGTTLYADADQLDAMIILIMLFGVIGGFLFGRAVTK